jgi:hypothetical protein
MQTVAYAYAAEAVLQREQLLVGACAWSYLLSEGKLSNSANVALHWTPRRISSGVMTMLPEWRNAGGWLGHGGVLLYSALAHAGGAYTMAHWRTHGLAAATAAVILVAHARIWAAYLIHEAAHGSVFKSLPHNNTFGTVALWLCVPPVSVVK